MKKIAEKKIHSARPMRKYSLLLIQVKLHRSKLNSRWKESSNHQNNELPFIFTMKLIRTYFHTDTNQSNCFQAFKQNLASYENAKIMPPCLVIKSSNFHQVKLSFRLVQILNRIWAGRPVRKFWTSLFYFLTSMTVCSQGNDRKLESEEVTSKNSPHDCISGTSPDW